MKLIRIFTILMFISSIISTQGTIYPCCQSCNDDRNLTKFYSIPKPYNNCGETCLPLSLYPFYKIVEPTLKITNTSHPCKLNGFQHYVRTDTEGLIKKIKVDIYDNKTN